MGNLEPRIELKDFSIKLGEIPLKICGICGERIASGVCRRCGRPICARCHFHHGLCKSCAKVLGRS